MAKQNLPPSAVSSQLNYITLNVGDIDESPSSPDTAYGTWDGNGNTACILDFDTPVGNPTTGAGVQSFSVHFRWSDAGLTPGYQLSLLENSATLTLLASGTMSASTQILAATWNAALLTDPTGAGVQLRFDQTSGGTGGTRRGIEIGAAVWSADYTLTTKSISATGLASTFAAGAATLTSKAYISATGLASGFAVGSHTISQPTTATLSVSASVPPGWKYTVFGTPNTASQYSVALDASPTLEATDMVVFQEFAQSGGVTQTASITISTDGIVTFSTRDPSASLSFKYFFWDESTSAYGTTATWSSPPIQTITATGKSTDEAFGTAVVTSNLTITATGLASEEAYGAAVVTSRAFLLPTGKTTDEAFGAHTLTPGPVSVLPTGLSSGETFGAHTLESKYHVSATGLATQEAFGTAVVTPGAAFLTPAGLSSNFVVGTHTVVNAAAPSATLSVSASVPPGWKFTTFSNPDISDSYNIAYGQSPTVVTSDMVIFQEFARKNGATTSYSLTISTDGSVTIFAQSDSSSLSFLYFFWDESTSAYGTTGTYNVLEYIHLAPTGFASEFTVGSHSITSSSIAIQPTGLATSEAFGTAVLTSEASIVTTGFASEEAFGTHTVSPGDVVIIPTGKSSDEAFGSPTILPGSISLQAAGLATEEAFGTHTLDTTASIQPTGVVSAFAVGSHLFVYTQYISPSGQEYLVIGTPRIKIGGITPLAVHDIFDWIYDTAETAGIAGGVMKKTKQYLILQGFTGSTNTAMFKWLRSLGYTGSLTNMIDDFERENTIQHG